MSNGEGTEPVTEAIPPLGNLFGFEDAVPSRRDIVRHRRVRAQLAHLTRKLETRKPGSRKFERTERRLAGIQDLIAAAQALGIRPDLTVRRTIRTVERLLGIDTNLRQIERGRAPDLSELAVARAARQPGPVTHPQPQPDAQGAPPGLPGSWWDWQLWQRALYGGLFAAGLRTPGDPSGRPINQGSLRTGFPPATVFNPQPAPPPGAATTIGGTVPFHDDLFGSIGSIDVGGLLEQGLDVFQDYYFGSIDDPGPGGRPLNRPPPGTFQTAGVGGLGAGLAGGAAAALLESFLGGNGAADTGLFRATEARILPRARIDAVGPDGRNYTWFRAIPYGWKVRGTKVGGKKRHHHHRRPY